MGRSIAADRHIAELAGRQHGVVSRGQLLESNVTSRMIQRRLANGHLRPIHRGVYLAGPVMSTFTHEMAAVLACGPGAVLSHRSAASVWKLLPRPTDPYPVDISHVNRDTGRSRSGIRLHRVARMSTKDRSTVEGLPVTSPSRTILDLAWAATIGRGSSRTRDFEPNPSVRAPSPVAVRTRDVEQAMARASKRDLLDLDDLAACLAACSDRPRRPGAVLLRRLLDSDMTPAMTRSEAEERFLALIRDGMLPPPEVNGQIGPYEVDFLWRELGIAVEVDGFAFHGSRTHFEGDRIRDADLAAEGIHVTRVTWRHLIAQPAAVLSRVSRALGRAGAR